MSSEAKQQTGRFLRLTVFGLLAAIPARLIGDYQWAIQVVLLAASEVGWRYSNPTVPVDKI